MNEISTSIAVVRVSIEMRDYFMLGVIVNRRVLLNTRNIYTPDYVLLYTKNPSI